MRPLGIRAVAGMRPSGVLPHPLLSHCCCAGCEEGRRALGGCVGGQGECRRARAACLNSDLTDRLELGTHRGQY